MGIGVGRPFGSESFRLDEDRIGSFIFLKMYSFEKMENPYCPCNGRFPTPGAR